MNWKLVTVIHLRENVGIFLTLLAERASAA
jgi:hypothetical protein